MEDSTEKKERRLRLKGDTGIWITVFFLIFISLIEVFSASSRLTFGKVSYLRPFISHSIHLAMGVAVMYVLHLFHYKWYKLIPVILLPISAILLAYLSFSGSGSGARWIDLGVFKLQPSELGKVAVVMAVASWLSKLKPDDELSQIKTFRTILITTVLFCLLIFTENLSTAVLLGAVVYVMMIVGGISWKRILALTGVVAVIGAGALVLMLSLTPQAMRESKFIPERAVTWQARIKDKLQHGTEVRESAFEYARNTAPEKPQETHANIAIATSHFLGKGLGNSVERDYLQEASCDFIYAIIIEEGGMLGGLIVLILYMYLLFRIGRIAARCREKYPAYLAIGLGVMLGLQAFVNMSVATGLFPVTGQPLPLISNGGSSVLVCSACIGMLQGICSTLDREKAAAQEQQPGVPEVIDSDDTFDNQ